MLKHVSDEQRRRTRKDQARWLNLLLCAPLGMVRRVHQGWPGLRLWQTENECGDGENTWNYAGHVFDLMQNALVTGEPATRTAVKDPAML